MITRQAQIEKEAVMEAARLVAAAARTAPKGRGIDRLEILILDGEDLKLLADQMERLTEESGEPFFARDAYGVRQSQAVVLMGTSNEPAGVPLCGYCGYSDCEQMQKNRGVCAFAITDLGVAAGSAASTAAHLKCDNRLLFSAGKAAIRLEYFETPVMAAYGLPLVLQGKSPFYDRDPH